MDLVKAFDCIFHITQLKSSIRLSSKLGNKDETPYRNKTFILILFGLSKLTIIFVNINSTDYCLSFQCLVTYKNYINYQDNIMKYLSVMLMILFFVPLNLFLVHIFIHHMIIYHKRPFGSSSVW